MEAAQVLRGLEQLVRRMSMLPGQRSLVVVSPGFLTLTLRFEVSEIADRALRSEVIISTFDSKGLYATPPLGELRWRAPLPPQPRSGVLEATSYPAPCIQPGGASGAIP